MLAENRGRQRPPETVAFIFLLQSLRNIDVIAHQMIDAFFIRREPSRSFVRGKRDFALSIRIRAMYRY
jgi:hypothetical protein